MANSISDLCRLLNALAKSSFYYYYYHKTQRITMTFVLESVIREGQCVIQPVCASVDLQFGTEDKDLGPNGTSAELSWVRSVSKPCELLEHSSL